MRLLLVTPPLTQLNTPYPATAQLKGFLQQQGHNVAQADLGIELVDDILQPAFLNRIGLPDHAACIEAVKHFLHGGDDTLAPRIANRTLLPEGPRFAQMADLEWAFGDAGTTDKARYLATLCIQDIADHIRTHLDPHFDLIRYAEHLAAYAPSFDELHNELRQPPSPLDLMVLELLQKHLDNATPDIVGFAIPFPGCLYAALRCGQYLKALPPERRPVVVFGGGFPNTEWRHLCEPRLFDYCDFVTLDDGEPAMSHIINLVASGVRHADHPVAAGDVPQHGYDFATAPAPDFEGLPMHRYLSLCDTTNPMHRLWSSGRWNKMMVAHGCYWHQCAFCDTTLPYIAHFAAPTATEVVNRMEAIARQTGITGFHFVDEALPPKLLKAVCLEILRRRLTVSFWGNIRFEKAYDASLCQLMAKAGCIAVSGGLEVASNRLLALMNKGVTTQQAVEACRHFRQAGIMVHTYLMYGFPTETLQETIDALQRIRLMFRDGIVQSAFWHRYAMTCHSPSGQHPEQFAARHATHATNTFCNNEVDFRHPFSYDLEAVGRGLAFATYNYMHGIGLDQPLHTWFTIKVPKTTIKDLAH